MKHHLALNFSVRGFAVARTARRVLAVILSLAFCASHTRAQGPLTVSAAVAALDELERTTGTIANQLEFSINSSVNNAVVGAGFAIAALRAQLEGLVGSTDRALTEQQARAFDHAVALVDRLSSSADSVLLNVEDLNNAVQQTLSSIPFFENEPRVTDIRTGPYVPGWSRNVVLTLRGSNLDDARNRLMVGTTDVRPSRRLATSIEFTIPAAALEALPRSVNASQLPVTVQLKFRRWLVLSERKDVPFRLTVVPRTIGEAEVFFVLDSLTSNRTTVVGAHCGQTTRGPGGSGRVVEQSKSCPYYPPVRVIESCGVNVQGQYVVGSVKTKVVSNRHGGRHSVSSESAGGFIVAVTARSDRGRFKGGGSYGVDVSYEVEYPCRVKAEVSAGTFPLVVGKPIAISLAQRASKNPKFARANLRLHDGSRQILTSAALRTSLASIGVNDALYQAVVSPVAVERH